MKGRKEYIQHIASKLYQWLLTKERIATHFLANDSVRTDFQLLTPGSDVGEKQKAFVIEKIKLCIYVLLFGGLLTAVLWIKQIQMAEIGDNTLWRASYGEGSQSVALQAYQDDTCVEIDVVVEEKVYTQEELAQMYPQFQQELTRIMLAKNVSLQYISYDLQLPAQIAGYPFTIAWETDGTYILETGKLWKEELEEPVCVEVRANISCVEFEKEERFVCQVYSRAQKATLEEKLTTYLQTMEETTRQEEKIELPTEIEGSPLTWKRQVSHDAALVLFLLPILMLLLLYSKDRDLHTLVVLRQEQMMYDYPEIVSKLALYIGAGMTLQNAWHRIAWDYQKTKGKQIRYAYEEMVITVREMENGLSQQKAFENYGRRCRHPLYLKLAMLLAQHVKKGTANIAQLLQQESANAFEQRKQQVRQQGEKAGTKLLIPMMILLFMIMIIILVPVFLKQV